MDNNTPPKHPGGRPPKDPSQKVIKCRISMTQAHHAATDGDRAGMIRRALDKYFRSLSPERIERAAKMEKVPLAEVHEFLKLRREIIANGGTFEQIENANDWIRTLLAV